MATDMTVARVILDQLGGNRFVAMTGAKHFTGGNAFLQFSIPTTRVGKINKVVITLNGKDLYDVGFFRMNSKTFSIKSVKTVNDIYAEDLQEVFTEATGLYTHL